MPRLIDVVVKDAKGKPVGGASVKWWNQKGQSDARSTDGSGYANFGEVVSEGITVEAIGVSGVKSTYVTTEDGHLQVVLDPFV